MKRIFISGIMAALIFSGCAVQKSPSATGEISEPVKPTPVYYLSGKIQAASAADMSASFSGRVETIPVEVGAFVKAGDPLVVFESSDSAAQAQIAQSAYEAAQANLEKARTGARPELIVQAEASLESARVLRDNAKKNLNRNEMLYQSGAVSASQLETVKGQAAAAEAIFRSADEQLAILKNGETKEFMAVLQKQAQQAKASWEASQTAQNNRTLRAPFDGVIVACPAKIGETYSAQTVLISLENQERLTVDAYGPASAAQLFKTGMKTVVRVAELPDRVFTGTVTLVGDTIDPKRRAILVKVSLEPADGLMAGMLAEIGTEQ